MIKLNKIDQFKIFCIEMYKNTIGISGMQAFSDFKNNNVFEFLNSGYEVLHTQSQSYIVAEIIEFIKNRK